MQALLIVFGQEAVEPLELVVRSELSLSDAVVGDSFPEPNAKRPKLDVQVNAATCFVLNSSFRFNPS